MADTAAATTPVKAKKPKVARAKPAHPPTQEMVEAAIKGLKERGGSSLIAIKKYIAANYKVDADKMATYIKKALKNGVTAGSLVQTKGKGASGSFKLSAASLKDKPKKPAAAAKKKTAKSPAKKVSTKKAVTPKKPTTKKAAKPKKTAKSPAAKKPSKAKKATKSPVKKPKAKKSPAKKTAAGKK